MSGPFWSKPLWDSDSDNDGESDGWFSAPSVMSVAKIVGSIAGGGPWLSFALDALDTAANVAMGNMSLKDGVTGLGKSGLTSVASGFASGIGAGIGDSIASAGLGSVTASVASSVATSYANTYISGAINSLEFDGGLSFNKDKFNKSTKGGWKSAAISGTTALVSSSIMSAGGAKWSNGRMGFTDKVGGSLEFANSWQKSISTIGNTAGAIAGQSLSAAFGDGFTMNFKGALQLQIGGRNSGLSVGGGGVSLDGIAGMMRGLGQLSDMKKSKEVQFLLNNHNSSEGMARMTYVNWGIKSGNENAMDIANDILNGEKSLVFKDFKKGHFGHAGIDNNQVQMNADAININENTLSKAGFFTSVMAREGFLIDENRKLGYGDSDTLSKDMATKLTRDAFEMQSGVLGDLTDNMGIRFTGEYGIYAGDVNRTAETGDLTGWARTGRDLSRAVRTVDLRAIGSSFIGTSVKKVLSPLSISIEPGSPAEAAKLLKDIAARKGGAGTIVLKDGSIIQTVPGGNGAIRFLKMGSDDKLQRMFVLHNKKIGYGNNAKTDLQALLDGAEQGGFNIADGLSYKKQSIDKFLNGAVSSYYKMINQNTHGGVDNAQNQRNGSSYNYQHTKQGDKKDYQSSSPVLPNHRTVVVGGNIRALDAYGRIMSEDPQYNPALVDRLGCTYSSKVNVFKSKGLIRPDLNVYQVDLMFKQIDDGSTQFTELTHNEGRWIGDKDGRYPNIEHSNVKMIQMAQQSDWAKLTGASSKDYYWDRVSSQDQITANTVYAAQGSGHTVNYAINSIVKNASGVITTFNYYNQDPFHERDRDLNNYSYSSGSNFSSIFNYYRMPRLYGIFER